MGPGGGAAGGVADSLAAMASGTLAKRAGSTRVKLVASTASVTTSQKPSSFASAAVIQVVAAISSAMRSSVSLVLPR